MTYFKNGLILLLMDHITRSGVKSHDHSFYLIRWLRGSVTRGMSVSNFKFLFFYVWSSGDTQTTNKQIYAQIFGQI